MMSVEVDSGQRATAPSDFIALLKPRVMSLVVFTGAVGLAVAPGTLHPLLAFVAVLCIAVGAGASGCINMWYERDIDAVMRRTCNRPIPTGRIEPRTALEFGVTLAVGSVMLMGLGVNWTAAALLALAICFYVFVYTIWLKRRTPQNIVIGGAAGAFPPMIGWAAVTGDVSMVSVVLFAIIFFWTPPHFWSLALYRTGDYEKAGIPMLPVVAGAAVTRRQIMLYAVLMLPLTLLPWGMGFAGIVYGVGAALLSLVFIAGAARILIARTDAAARWMFRYSIVYLALIFALLIADKALQGIV
jgi:protoheme IX farnesyltransferase